MDFKRSTFGIILIALLSFVSCDRFLKDSAPADEAVQVNVEGMSCLDELSPTFQQIFDGNVVDKNVDGAFGCLNRAMAEFRDKTTDEVYTSGSLVKFFNEKLLTQNHIDPSFEVQLLKVKQVFLGGTGNVLTRTELNKLIAIFDTLGKEIKKIGPHLPLLLQKKTVTTASLDKINKASAAAQAGIAALYDKMEIESTEFNLNNASDFLRELAIFLKDTSSTSQLNTFRDLIPFVQSALDAFYGTARDKIPLKEIKRRTAAMIKGYAYYLEYHFQLDGNKMTTIAGTAKWISFLDRAFNYIESDSNIATRGLGYAELKTLLVELKARKWMPWDITPDTLEKTAKVIFRKIGNPGHAQVSETLISLAQWKSIRWEYSQWRLSEQLFAQVPFDPTNDQIDMPKLLAWMEKAPVDAQLAKDTWTAAQKEGLKASWVELQTLMKQRRPIKFNKAGGIMLVDDNLLNSYTQTWTDTLRFTVMRTMNRLLFLGYSNQKNLDLASALITEKQLQDWYADFTPIGVELKFFDPRSGNSGSRSFLEASHFTAYSDGSDAVDYNEGFQYVNYLFAAGLVNADQMYETMKEQGCATSKLDILGNPFLEENCFKAKFRQHFGKIFANLPNQVAYVQKMSDAQWNEYYAVLMDAARTEFTQHNAGVLVETSDVRTLATLSHYIESLFTEFDKNIDGFLDEKEIRAGHKRFLPFLRKFRPGYADWILREGFVIMVVNGELPKDIMKALSDFIFKDQKAPRVQLLKVISTLKTGL